MYGEVSFILAVATCSCRYGYYYKMFSTLRVIYAQNNYINVYNLL
jgi:hypothetical protein